MTTRCNPTTVIAQRHLNQSARRRGDQPRKLFSYLPTLIGLFLGLFWSVVHLVLGDLHGMWPMFDRGFPFLLPRLFQVPVFSLSKWSGTIFAFADAAAIGTLLAWGIRLVGGRLLGSGRERPRHADANRRPVGSAERDSETCRKI